MAQQPINKKVINYYASFYEVSKQLDQKQFYKFNNAIFSVMFYEEHIDNITFKDKLLSIAWLSIKHSLRASIDGFCSKNKLDYDTTLSKGLSKGDSKGLTNNEKDNDNDNVKGNEKDKKSITNFYPNKSGLELINKHYPEVIDIQPLIDDFIEKAINREKPFKDLNMGFRNYLKNGYITPYTDIKQQSHSQRAKQLANQMTAGNPLLSFGGKVQ